jgi:hypothetical protein
MMNTLDVSFLKEQILFIRTKISEFIIIYIPISISFSCKLIPVMTILNLSQTNSESCLVRKWFFINLPMFVVRPLYLMIS